MKTHKCLHHDRIMANDECDSVTSLCPLENVHEQLAVGPGKIKDQSSEIKAQRSKIKTTALALLVSPAAHAIEEEGKAVIVVDDRVDRVRKAAGFILGGLKIIKIIGTSLS